MELDRPQLRKTRPATRRLTLRFTLVVAGLVLGFAGCAPEAQTEYSQDTNVNFFAGCSDPETDSALRVELCQCIYQRIQLQIPYEKLDVLDDELVADPEFRLQSEFVTVIADCVIRTGDLAS